MRVDANGPANAFIEQHRYEHGPDLAVLEKGRIDVRTLGGLKTVQRHVHAEEAMRFWINPDHHVIGGREQLLVETIKEPPKAATQKTNQRRHQRPVTGVGVGEVMS